MPFILKSQPQFQTRSMPSQDLNNLFLDFWTKFQKSLEGMSSENNKKNMAAARPGEKK